MPGMNHFTRAARRAALILAAFVLCLAPVTVAGAAPQWAAREYLATDQAASRDLGVAPELLDALAANTSAPRHRPASVWLLALERAQTDVPGLPGLTRPEPGVKPYGTAWAQTLTCGPVGGSHPQRIKACKHLTMADGHIDMIDPDTTGVCTDEYDPHVATAEGMFAGEPRHFSVQFNNRCEAQRQTGGVVFRWDS